METRVLVSLSGPLHLDLGFDHGSMTLEFKSDIRGGLQKWEERYTKKDYNVRSYGHLKRERIGRIFFRMCNGAVEA